MGSTIYACWKRILPAEQLAALHAVPLGPLQRMLKKLSSTGMAEIPTTMTPSMTDPTLLSKDSLLACPYCGKSDTVSVTDSTEFHMIDCECNDVDEGNDRTFAVVCDASRPKGPGGCGASGGFHPTRSAAIAAWNRRIALMTKEKVQSLVARLRARADNAYLSYIDQSRQDKCLGWEIKVERGTFDATNLDAHTKRGELLGRHRALHEAAKLLEEEFGNE